MKYIPYGHQSISQSDVQAVVETLHSDWLTQGPKVKAFEVALAKAAGAKYAVAVTNGTAALHLAYLAAEIGKGDEVITTPNTFVATSNMLLAVGVKPVFCDIRPDTYNIDETKIEALITKKTKAIVPVHFAGHPVELKKIYALAKKHHLLVIEDACHALGAKYDGRLIGERGDMAVYSFHPVKTITTGEGGAIVTNNKKFYERLLHLRSHGITKDKNGFNVMTELGYNYRLSDINAALGKSQLVRLPQFIEARRKVVSLYREALGGVPGIILPIETKEAESAWHLFVIRVQKESDRLPLYRYLQKNNIGVNFHYPAVYSHPYYRKHGYAKTIFPVMDQYAKSAITIPLYPDLAHEDIEFIAKTIRAYFA